MTTPAQLKAIHAIRRRSGMLDHEYRTLLADAGAASSKDLSTPAAAAFIDRLQRIDGRLPASTATGRFAPKLRALWLSAWHLGLVGSSDDRAMQAFVQRQCRVTHTRFLIDPKLAAKAIEGLKAWIAREGGVEWPPATDAVWALKAAVCRAILDRLREHGVLEPAFPGDEAWPDEAVAFGHRHGLPDILTNYTDGDWDRLAALLGARLRKALTAETREAAHA